MKRRLSACYEMYPQERARLNDRPSSPLRMARGYDEPRESYDAGLKRSSGYDPASEALYGKRERINDFSLNSKSHYESLQVSSARCGDQSSLHYSPGRELDDHVARSRGFPTQEVYDHRDDYQDNSPNFDKNINPKFYDPYVGNKHSTENTELSRNSGELRRISYSEEKELVLKYYESHKKDNYFQDKNYEDDRFDYKKYSNSTSGNKSYSREDSVVLQDDFPRSKTERERYFSRDIQHPVFDERFSDVNRSNSLLGRDAQRVDDYDRSLAGQLGDCRSLDNSSRSKNFVELPDNFPSSSNRYNDPKGYVDHHDGYRKTGYPDANVKEKNYVYSRNVPSPVPLPIIEDSGRSSSVQLSQILDVIKKPPQDCGPARDILGPGRFRNSVNNDYFGDGSNDYNQQKGFGRSGKFLDQTRGIYEQLKNSESPENIGKFPLRNDYDMVKKSMESENYELYRSKEYKFSGPENYERGSERSDFYNRQRVIGKTDVNDLIKNSGPPEYVLKFPLIKEINSSRKSIESEQFGISESEEYKFSGPENYERGDSCNRQRFIDKMKGNYNLHKHSVPSEQVSKFPVMKDSEVSRNYVEIERYGVPGREEYKFSNPENYERDDVYVNQRFIDKTGGNDDLPKYSRPPELVHKLLLMKDHDLSRKFVESERYGVSGREEYKLSGPENYERGDFYDRQRIGSNRNSYINTERDDEGRNIIYEGSRTGNASDTNHDRTTLGYSGQNNFGLSETSRNIKSGQSWDAMHSRYDRPGCLEMDDWRQRQDHRNSVISVQPLDVSSSKFDRSPRVETGLVKRSGLVGVNNRRHMIMDKRYGNDNPKGCPDFDCHFNTCRDDKIKPNNDLSRNYDRSDNRSLARNNDYFRESLRGGSAPGGRNSDLHRSSFTNDRKKSRGGIRKSRSTRSKDDRPLSNNRKYDTVPNKLLINNTNNKSTSSRSCGGSSNKKFSDSNDPPKSVSKDSSKSEEIKNKDSDAKDKPEPKCQASSSVPGLLNQIGVDNKQNCEAPDKNLPDTTKKDSVSVADKSLSDGVNVSNQPVEGKIMDTPKPVRDSGLRPIEKVRNIEGPCGRNLVVVWMQKESPFVTLDRTKVKMNIKHYLGQNFDEKTQKWTSKVIFGSCVIATETAPQARMARMDAAIVALKRLREHYYTLRIKRDYYSGELVVDPYGRTVPRILESPSRPQQKYVAFPDFVRVKQAIDDYVRSDNINELEFSTQFAPKDKQKIKKYAKEVHGLKVRHMGPKMSKFILLLKDINIWTIVEGLANKDPRFSANYELLPPLSKG